MSLGKPAVRRSSTAGVRPHARRSRGAPQELAPLLRAARSRLLKRTLLVAALGSVAVNVILVGVGAGLQRLFGFRLPVPYIAPLLVAVAAWRALLRLDPMTVAREIDRRAAFKDRLATAVDFAGRPGLDPVWRRAQVGETLAVAPTLDLRRIIRIAPLLWVGPLVFLAHLWVNVVNPFLPLTRRVFVARAPGGRRVPGEQSAGEQEERSAGTPDRPRPVQSEEQRPPTNPGNGITMEHPADKRTPPGMREAPLDAKPDQKPLPDLFSKPPHGVEAEAPLTAGEQDDNAEPMQLFSETEGAKLTPVSAEPLNSSAPSPRPVAPVQASGRLSFNLTPMGAGEGEGGESRPAAGGRNAAIRIVVDFDRVPPTYRDLVKRYFEGLQRMGEGRAGGT